MVFAEFFCFPLDGGNRAGVASIGTINVFGSDQDHIGSASSMRFLLILGPIILLLHLSLDCHNLFLACFGEKQLIYLEKSLFEGFFIIFFLIICIGFELLNKVSFCKGGDFWS